MKLYRSVYNKLITLQETFHTSFVIFIYAFFSACCGYTIKNNILSSYCFIFVYNVPKYQHNSGKSANLRKHICVLLSSGFELILGYRDSRFNLLFFYNCKTGNWDDSIVCLLLNQIPNWFFFLCDLICVKKVWLPF